MNELGIYDELLFGANKDRYLVALELEESDDGDSMELFVRRQDDTLTEKEPFRPFILVDPVLAGKCEIAHETVLLQGGGRLGAKLLFRSWKDLLKAKAWFSRNTGFSASSPDGPYYLINDPVHQHLISTGRTLFLGMDFESLRRLQIDIECVTTDGYEFCNAEREGDCIVAIAMADQTGWIEVLSGAEMDEKKILQTFVKIVKERDPDVIEGHNIFNFDMPYIKSRAKMHGVKLGVGRDGTVPGFRPSRFSIGERTISYQRCDIYGRSVIDTLFLVHGYDISHRSLSGYGLKEVARHFGLSEEGRTYIAGPDISNEFKNHPDRVMEYVRDDVSETRSISDMLSKSIFVQAQILPYSYQDVAVRGNATKIDALMIREYIRNNRALPIPSLSKEFAGGYTDIFEEGVIENVHHCDIRSLYPSLMLTRHISPAADDLGVFPKLLERLKEFRMDSKRRMQESAEDSDRNYYDALQTAFKILINSFYGYLGFAQGHFNDFEAAERVTREGRDLLRQMIGWLTEHGAKPIEIDTDGIYFVPPAGHGIGMDDKPGRKDKGAVSVSAGQQAFRDEFRKFLPDGIEVEFDGEYKSMYSYKMKNYALLTYEGEVIIKGGALKSRGLEPFQRSFLEAMIGLKLENREDEILSLKKSYEKAILKREWPVERLAKTETLQDAPSTYATKREKGKTPKRAVYELALRSEREYRAGDQVSYYVTGDKKNVVVHENARLVSEWDPENRDENVLYYASKLDGLFEKFCDVEEQGRLF